MTTTWVIYRDLEPIKEITCSVHEIDNWLEWLKTILPGYCWDAYAQKWGEWFND